MRSDPTPVRAAAWRIAIHAGALTAMAVVGHLASRGVDGALFAGVTSLLAISALRAVIDAVAWRRASLVVPTVAVLLSPLVMVLAMLPGSRLVGMAGALFLILPAAAIIVDGLALTGRVLWRWRGA